jgi:hypothetical protein
MPSYAGKFQYQNPSGGTQQQGACRLTFEQDRLMLVPDSGDPLALDLGDIDVFAPSDYELSLTIYTGNKILLEQFGKAFQNLAHDLLEAYRARLVRCLLLEDLEEVARFDGMVRLETSNPDHRPFAGPAEFRLYKSNLAVLPLGATGFQWRLADIESVRLDDASYTVNLDSRGERLVASKLAKRTREFSERVTEAVRASNEQAAKVLRDIFPFLSPDQFQRVAHLMKEGRAASLAALSAIHPRIEQALIENVLDAPLKPYFAALKQLSWKGGAFAGFKLVRPDETGKPAATVKEETAEEDVTPEDTTDIDAGSGPAEVGPQVNPILHWFFFPIAGKAGDQGPANLVAWEATSATGRATYFFRLLPQEQAAQLQDSSRAQVLVETAIRQLNSTLVLLNFRREPIYLPDDSLEIRPSFHRYVIASRKIVELRRLRAQFLGRAIHGSLPAWQDQVNKVLATSYD